jgi:hypothetical protein
MNVRDQLRAVRQSLATFGVKRPLGLARVTTYLAKTVWDPARTDIAYGVNLADQALREIGPQERRTMAERLPKVAALYEEGYNSELLPDRPVAEARVLLSLGRAAEAIVALA